jgi:hypothetical protein
MAVPSTESDTQVTVLVEVPKLPMVNVSLDKMADASHTEGGSLNFIYCQALMLSRMISIIQVMYDPSFDSQVLVSPH